MDSGKSDEISAKKYFLGEIGNSPLVNKIKIANQQKTISSLIDFD